MKTNNNKPFSETSKTILLSAVVLALAAMVVAAMLHIEGGYMMLLWVVFIVGYPLWNSGAFNTFKKQH